MTISIGILGARGRMGDALVAAILGSDMAALAGGVERAGHADIGLPLCAGSALLLGDDTDALARMCDVLIDFTSPVPLQRHLDVCTTHKTALVVGTTGLEPHHDGLLQNAAQHIPVLQSYNMSVGVTLLAALVQQTAARLGPEWDIEIAEMHHRHKVDAPSGTALLLGRAAAQGRNINLAANAARGRDGITGARATGAIGFASLRGGSVAGDHMVIFAGDDERIEFTHRAENRMVFARGAVRAAAWLAGQAPGQYAMTDVLGL
jgi:4-hydroxy-tetrahydrodipicolinate reductase